MSLLLTDTEKCVYVGCLYFIKEGIDIQPKSAAIVVGIDKLHGASRFTIEQNERF